MTRHAVQAVPLEAVELVVRSVDLRRIRELLSFLAAELVSVHTYIHTLQYTWLTVDACIHIYSWLLYSVECVHRD